MLAGWASARRVASLQAGARSRDHRTSCQPDGVRAVSLMSGRNWSGFNLTPVEARRGDRMCAAPVTLARSQGGRGRIGYG